MIYRLCKFIYLFIYIYDFQPGAVLSAGAAWIWRIQHDHAGASRQCEGCLNDRFRFVSCVEVHGSWLYIDHSNGIGVGLKVIGRQKMVPKKN